MVGTKYETATATKTGELAVVEKVSEMSQSARGNFYSRLTHF
ncbi:hypothetical protein THTE_3588 [Thermogutta terrifontis]|uniref:Uncharacterized protein n=1 Tax=Thermogutta terrifontis TaxID=1331910 RepID=A0A286RJP4_9BACT|nr:hypothetical protein THTE_3588 [Thermogutta terrifontis]